MEHEYLEFAKSVAYEAGEVMRKYYGKKPSFRLKEDETIVTIADEEINEMVIKRVEHAYPAHGVDGEESSAKKDSKYLWVCDPIDGTALFAREVPFSMFSLALVIDGEPVLGVAYDPFHNKLFWAAQGEGAWLDDMPLQVSQAKLDNRSMVNVEASYAISSDARMTLEKRGVLVTSMGSAVRTAVMVASGRMEAMIFGGTEGKNVDIAAVKVIVEESGGKVTDLNGKEQRYDGAINGAIVSNGMVHDEIVQYMQQQYEKEKSHEI